jgi:hypothetical protein
MKWLHYLLEVNCYIAVFYLGYLLVLRRETHYTLNRAYLLLTVLISFVVPVLQLGILQPSLTELNLTIVPVALHFTTISLQVAPVESHFTLQYCLWDSYLAGVIVSALMLLIKLFRLFQLARTSKVELRSGYKLIRLEDEETAFSFFGYLFIGSKMPSKQTVLAHELVHIRQKHSLDVVFIELLKVTCWFNPFIYLLQRSIRAVHEYIADERVAGLSMDRIAYSSFLVENAYGLNGPVLTNSFFNYNLLKRRIIMLNQTPSGNLARLKYLLIVPVSIALLCASTLAFSKDYDVIDLLPGAKVALNRTNNAAKVKSPLVTQNSKAGRSGAMEIRPAAAIDTPKIAVDYRPKRTSHVSAKGYKYTEEGYLVKGKADFRVIIVQKDGIEKEYWKSKASPAEIKMLKDTYGYTFPSMPIYSRMPPPPPAPPLINIKLSPPPPPAPPAKGVGVIAQPLPANPETAIKMGRTITVAIDSDAYTRADLKNKDQTPVIVVNGSIYKLKEPLQKGQELIVSSDTTNAVMYTDEDLKQAVARYGPAAANGVIFAHGKTSVEVK